MDRHSVAKKRLLVVLILMTIASLLVVILYNLNIISFHRVTTYFKRKPEKQTIKDFAATDEKMFINFEANPVIKNSVDSANKGFDQGINLQNFKIPDRISELLKTPLNPPSDKKEPVEESAKMETADFNFVDFILDLDTSVLAKPPLDRSIPEVQNGIVYRVLTSLFVILDDLFSCQYVEELEAVTNSCGDVIDIVVKFAHSFIASSPTFSKFKEAGFQLPLYSLEEDKERLENLVKSNILPVRLLFDRHRNLKPLVLEVMVHLAPFFVNLPSVGINSKIVSGNLSGAQKALYKIMIKNERAIPSRGDFNTIKKVVASLKSSSLGLTDVVNSQSPKELFDALLKYKDQFKNTLNIAVLLDVFQAPMQENLLYVIHPLLKCSNFDLFKRVFNLIRSSIVSLDYDFDLLAFWDRLVALLSENARDPKREMEGSQVRAHLKEDFFNAEMAESLANQLALVLDGHSTRSLLKKAISLYSHIYSYGLASLGGAVDSMYLDFRIFRFWDKEVGLTFNAIVKCLTYLSQSE
jgi:hypothetical protein